MVEPQVQKFMCPTHGVQQMIGLQLNITDNLKGTRVTRDYCMECWIEMNDRFMDQLTPITED